MFGEYKSHDIAVYAGYINDEMKLLQSASGGVATAISEKIITDGGYVAGVAYAKDFKKAEYIIVNKIEDIDRLKGSKYIESDKGNIY
jgi:hypothetical protein